MAGMIRACFFDLDDTLVQTEPLKGASYATAAIRLRPELQQEEVLAAFSKLVGKSREEVATGLLNRFALEAPATVEMEKHLDPSPLKAFLRMRLDAYATMLADPDTILAARRPHVVLLLHWARNAGLATALGTMSHRNEARRVVDVVGLTKSFDFMATRDDVGRGKPDPEIYLLLANSLGLRADECLVLEDSPNGARAALAARMHVVAVPTDLTIEDFRTRAILPRDRVVEDPRQLESVVRRVVNASAGAGAADATR